ncbi:MAG: PAS domain S-box protein [Burkholderiales bacterium]|nr:PAS domain S-box protein [Burkholderiales bacterium]
MLAFLLLLSLVWPMHGHASPSTPIFVLHSYSQEYPWTKRQHEGFLRKLGTAVPGMVAPSVEYLDTKRVPYTAAYADFFADYLVRKYVGFAPKLIYVTDDNALVFALRHLTRIFPKAPIFFSGVNDYDMRQRIDPSRVTGVYEKKEIAPNLDLMRHLDPKARDILVVGDESGTFEAIRHEVVAELAREPDIKAHFLSAGRIEQLVAALKGRKERFVFLTTLGEMKDAAGRVLSLPETIAAIAQAGRFVIISMEDVYLYPGVLGGYVTSGDKQGAVTAELVARYLAGTAVADIKPIETSPNEYLIDGSEQERLGLTLPPAIAADATIVNPVPTFIERNLALIERGLYAFALLFMVSLAVFAIALLRKNRQIARASAELETLNGRLHNVIESFPVILWAIDREGVFTLSRGAGLKALGLAPDEVLGRSVFQMYAEYPKIISQVRRTLEGEPQLSTVLVGAIVFEMHYSPIFDSQGVVIGASGVSIDITERRRAENALKSSEEKFRKAYNVNPDAVNINRLDDGRYVSINAGFTRTMGYTEDEIVGHSSLQFDIWDDPEDRVRLVQGLKNDGTVTNLEARFRAKDGSIRYGLMSASLVEIDGVPHILSITRDITERTHFQQQLAEGEAQFRSLVEQSIAGTYIVQDGKFAYVNPRYAEIFGYDSAEELIGRDILSIVAEQDRGTVTENVSRRIEGDIETIKYDFAGLRKDGSIVDIGVHGASATHRGRPAVIGMVQDISEKKRAEEKIQSYVAQLETAFMSTVQVATTLGEMRDPYTAGHQRHVAEIAVAIGAELGFDARRQEGLRVAGYLHDIGKITVPAEILSKPGKLSPIEFQLIQGHPQSGYEVLKDLVFPWPVAEVALQHHERIDGSGYPQGLKGEAILLEARIMAVADVVEAMSTHRPYRPGLGIARTLAEIERGRGSAYDAEVADACLRLFRDKGYSIAA